MSARSLVVPFESPPSPPLPATVPDCTVRTPLLMLMLMPMLFAVAPLALTGSGGLVGPVHV